MSSWSATELQIKEGKLGFRKRCIAVPRCAHKSILKMAFCSCTYPLLILGWCPTRSGFYKGRPQRRFLFLHESSINLPFKSKVKKRRDIQKNKSSLLPVSTFLLRLFLLDITNAPLATTKSTSPCWSRWCDVEWRRGEKIFSRTSESERTSWNISERVADDFWVQPRTLMIHLASHLTNREV